MQSSDTYMDNWKCAFHINAINKSVLQPFTTDFMGGVTYYTESAK